MRRLDVPFLSIVLAVLCFSVQAFPAETHTELVMKNPWLVLRALMVSYPDRISGVDYDSEANDWFMTIDNRRLYWAEGRLLPKERVGEAEKWRPYLDYLYPRETPDPSTFSPELIERIKKEADAEERGSMPVYDLTFYDILYDGATRRKIESHITRFDYLGLRVSVHESLVDKLKRIESKLYALAAADGSVREFISSLSSIEGYNWREVADSPLRSNHTWGIAIDILPKNWGQKNLYWNWISWFNDKWMLIPLERRWMPPDPVIRTFEEEGFVWGGKWHLWDTMHFEYRPELLTLQKWGHFGDE